MPAVPAPVPRCGVGAAWPAEESVVAPGYATPDPDGTTLPPRNVDKDGKLTPGGTSGE